MSWFSAAPGFLEDNSRRDDIKSSYKTPAMCFLQRDNTDQLVTWCLPYCYRRLNCPDLYIICLAFGQAVICPSWEPDTAAPSRLHCQPQTYSRQQHPYLFLWAPQPTRFFLSWKRRRHEDQKDAQQTAPAPDYPARIQELEARSSVSRAKCCSAPLGWGCWPCFLNLKHLQTASPVKIIHFWQGFFQGREMLNKQIFSAEMALCSEIGNFFFFLKS